MCVLIPLLWPSCAVVRLGFEWRSCVIFGSSSGWWLLRGEETEGELHEDQNQGCLRDFCLRELLCNDQRLIMDACECVCLCIMCSAHLQNRAGMHICSFSASLTPHIRILIQGPHTLSNKIFTKITFLSCFQYTLLFCFLLL